jgi:hypothetical protein
MLSSTSFTKLAIFMFCLWFGVLCAPPARGEQSAAAPMIRLAVLPLDNLSNAVAPLKEIQQALRSMLSASGVQVVDNSLLAEVMARHRIRYTGGLDAETAKELKAEAGADAVLITSLELYLPDTPPKIALTARVVMTDTLEIRWMQSVALSGDDAPGLLDLGMIRNPEKLQEKAERQLAGLLAAQLASGGRTLETSAPRVFRPKSFYAGDGLSALADNRVAVTPFYNESPRYRAGEILLLHFLQQLVATGRVRVVEPGEVRQRMLQKRIVMEDGLSYWDLNLIGIPLKVDYFVTGRIFQYRDNSGPFTGPVNDFSATLFSLGSRKTIWASSSYNRGDDNAGLFDFGRVSTASALADKMVSVITRLMLGRH